LSERQFSLYIQVNSSSGLLAAARRQLGRQQLHRQTYEHLPEDVERGGMVRSFLAIKKWPRTNNEQTNN